MSNGEPTVTVPETLRVPPERATRWMLAAGGLTAVGAVASLVGYVTDFRQAAFSYLFAYLFVLTLALGSLFWVIIHHLTVAGWSVVIHRLHENVIFALPVLAVLFVPVMLYLGVTYRWADADYVASLKAAPPGTPEHEAYELWEAKHGYLNRAFFTGRAVLYFAVWSGLALLFNRLSVRQDTTGDPALTRRMGAWSGPAVPALALTATFAAFDWVMALNYTWYSTMWGVYFWAGGILGSLAAVTLIALALRAAGYLRGVVTEEHLHDLGKLLFTFTIFWTYIGFCQYMLIWYANIPEETSFFRLRQASESIAGVRTWDEFVGVMRTWNGFSLALAVGHFAVPFLFLLPRGVKRNPVTLGLAAAWILLFHLIDVYWQVLPALHNEGYYAISWMDFSCLMMLVGMVALVFLAGVRNHALVPVRDPRLRESVNFHND
jgi:hypothetical protein